jgi:hypothetical protein
MFMTPHSENVDKNIDQIKKSHEGKTKQKYSVCFSWLFLFGRKVTRLSGQRVTDHLNKNPLR